LAGEDARLRRAVEQVDENLRIILAEGDRLTSLINDVLDLEKIRAGKMVWRMKPLNPAEIIERAAGATAALFEGKDLAWVSQAPPDLPPVLGDRDRLVQVCINLISNAVKFTNTGTITGRAEVVDRAGRQREVVVSIADQGIGIAKEDQPLVFEKFMQVGDTLTNKPRGTGLGLPICKEIVENHGGRIWLESEPGQGSTFFFSLPAIAGAAPNGPAQPEDTRPAGREDGIQQV
jgi:signal transduction histidine kinase